MGKKTLELILAGALALGHSGCGRFFSNESPGNADSKQISVYTKQPCEIKSVSGEITSIDEDAVPVYITHPKERTSSSYPIEFIRIKTPEGNFNIISPCPTGFVVGDKVDHLKIEVLPDGRIPLVSLIQPLVCQKGTKIHRDEECTLKTYDVPVHAYGIYKGDFSP